MARRETSDETPAQVKSSSRTAPSRKSKLFDRAIINKPQAAIDFITNIPESSTEYSVIAKDLAGKILLWNEGARRLCAYEPDEVVGKMNSSVLHIPEDVRAGLPQKIMAEALQHGKFEGTVARKRKNGDLNMPRMNGIQLVQALRKDEDLRHSIAFILTTSKRDEDKVAAYDLNVTRYIVKATAGRDFLNLVNLVDCYWRIVEMP